MLALPMQRSSIGRAGIDRMSVNPISAIVGGIQSAVDHVAGGGEHNLRHIISKCAAPARHSTHSMTWSFKACLSCNGFAERLQRGTAHRG